MNSERSDTVRCKVTVKPCGRNRINNAVLELLTRIIEYIGQ